ncbi:MAG: class I SAM-dependent methyltransferase [Proteobacteria bacterium]|nr:class I SAM-dependent methyltransferase [Pseudomonadota bacterium]
MPKAEANGTVPTLNGMGAMTPELDPYASAFVDFAAFSKVPVLDVGAAYGIATLAALERGARVIANDVEPRHLEILSTRVPEERLHRLRLFPGAFPGGLSLAHESIGAALLGRMLHFLSGDEIERGIANLRRWLVPGGKVFAVALTPYIGTRRDFIPVYESRRAAGLAWPGERERMHYLEPAVLAAAFERAGFDVEVAETFSRPELLGDMRLDGRESMGLIARKP